MEGADAPDEATDAHTEEHGLGVVDALGHPWRRGRGRLHHIYKDVDVDEEDEGANHVDNEPDEYEDRPEHEDHHCAAVWVLEGQRAGAEQEETADDARDDEQRVEDAEHRILDRLRRHVLRVCTVRRACVALSVAVVPVAGHVLVVGRVPIVRGGGQGCG
eukprot:scaffold69309_cov65-Phaeocystis_antarctica.AAC.1